MKNKEIADMFNDLYYILSMDEKSKFEALAYQRAARSIESMPEDVSIIYKREGIEGLLKIPGIGKGLASHIVEYLTTGKIEKYEELKNAYPIDFNGLMRLEGFGSRKAIILYNTLGIKNVEELKKAAENHEIRDIPGFGEKSEELILKSISLLDSIGGKILLGTGLAEARKIIWYLTAANLADRCAIAGSIRRMKETVGDIDILVISWNPEKIMKMFVKFEDVKSVIVRGNTKTTVLLNTGTTCDLRVIKPESFGSALQYF
ncbi:helix-hairpin-helix domain-containing protein, partial [Ferroplasma sp. Type II]|uniref:helix-hairpin-helix domain-containing protein n=1 Tax=Ferroplasma sp. Type II TaxID=261388 RepID=UPI0025BB73BF